MHVIKKIIDFVGVYRYWVLSLALVVGLSLLLLVRRSTLSRLDQEAAVLNETLVAINKNMRYAVGLEEDLSALNGLVEEINSRLLVPSDKAQNLRFLYTLEEKTGIVLKDPLQEGSRPWNGSGKELKPEAKAPFELITLSLSIQGTFQQILEFMEYLRADGPFIRIVAMDMQVNDQSALGQIEAMFRIEALGEYEE